MEDNKKEKKTRKQKRLEKHINMTPQQIKRRKTIIRTSIIVLFVIVFLIGIVLGINAHTWKTLAKEMLVNKHSVIKDTDGNVIATLGEEKDKRIKC